MPWANVNDRASLERVYPPEAYARDVARNDQALDPLRYGVAVRSAPDAGGRFELSQAVRHPGEPESPVFLAPAKRVEELVDGGRAPSQRGPAQPQRGYDAFLDDIVDAATRFGFRPEDAPGRNEPRLRGLRGG
jgi:hypothetical protein